MSKKKKRRHAPPSDPVAALKHQLQDSGLMAQYQPAAGQLKGRKISEVFLEFIAPFKSAATTQDSFEKLIVTGIIAWNAALVTGAERQKRIDSAVQVIIDQAGETWRKDAEATIALLIRHKERAFAADRRYIVDYRLTDTGQAWHLAMAALE
jgi:hypothetical protein